MSELPFARLNFSERLRPVVAGIVSSGLRQEPNAIPDRRNRACNKFRRGLNRVG